MNNNTIFTLKIYYSRKYNNRFYLLQAKNPQKTLMKLEVREKVCYYEHRVIPFELLYFHCQDDAGEHLSYFFEKVINDLSEYVDRHYISSMIYNLVYCKSDRLIAKIRPYIPYAYKSRFIIVSPTIKAMKEVVTNNIKGVIYKDDIQDDVFTNSNIEDYKGICYEKRLAGSNEVIAKMVVNNMPYFDRNKEVIPWRIELLQYDCNIPQKSLKEFIGWISNNCRIWDNEIYNRVIGCCYCVANEESLLV